MRDNADYDKEALRSYELEPRSTERPAQKWCPVCCETIIERDWPHCLDCEDDIENALQSEEK
jgi:hypothetical protein